MQQLGRYQIISELGRGGMGVVYRAFDPALRREVAIKTILYSQVTDPGQKVVLKDRLLREATAAGTLAHPGIVPVHDVIQDGETMCIVMAYIKGSTLAQVIETHKGRPVPADRGTKLLREIGSALDHAHRKGVIHRDIKPSNIIIDEYGSAKIMDFGIAKVASCQTMTQTGFVIGTPEYMSPEQIMAKPVDGKSDQFSLAIVAYLMFTGQTPFAADSFISLSFKIVQEEPLPPSTANPALPKRVNTVLLRGLAKAPSDRFETCSAFAEAVSGAILHREDERRPSVRRRTATTLPPRSWGTPQGEIPERTDDPISAAPLDVIRRHPSPAPVVAPDLRSAGRKPGEVRINPVDKLPYCWVPAGQFQMGCTKGDSACDLDERPSHRVVLRHGIWVGQSPTTVVAYEQFVLRTGRKMPVAPKFNPQWSSRDHPIVNVNWEAAQAYCKWAGGRLPTEAEWEYAARGGNDTSIFPWGNDVDRAKANWAGKGTTAVGAYPANGYGLFDMIGNAWEWCQDWYSDTYYGEAGSIDPQGPPSGELRACRGGSWINRGKYLRVSFRNKYKATDVAEVLGFRCVVEVYPA